jgi:hypothetical protein
MRSDPSRWLPFCAGVLAVASILTALARCGGTRITTATRVGADASVADGPSDDGADATSSCVGFGCAGDAGDELVLLASCPATPPAVGSSCVGEGACEYGPNWFLTCNLVMWCAQGIWHAPPQYPNPCSVKDAGVCPATWAEATATDASWGRGIGSCPALECQYPQGSCACLSCGAGQGQVREQLLYGFWSCFAATAQCPSPRPDLGTRCDSDASCNYGGSCCTGQNLQCTGGMWHGYSGQVCP